MQQADNHSDFSELYTPSNSYGIYSLLKNLFPLGLIYTLAPRLAEESPLLAWSLAPVVGLLIYRLTMIMHDCGHMTLFSSRKANLLIGKYLGGLTGIDFDSFRDRHWEHHKIYGEFGDPQGFHYIGIDVKSRLGFVWHLLRPLLGYNVKYVISESILSPGNLIKSFRNGDIFIIVLLQVLTLSIVTNFGNHIHLAFLPAISAITFGLFFSQIRGIAEHGSRNQSQEPKLVRSHAPEALGRLLLYDVNFNFHKEHHDHPGIPSCNLRLLHTKYTGQADTQTTIWQTLTRIIRSQGQVSNG